MFDVFQLKSCGAGLMGYRWDVSSPRLVVCLIHGIGEHAGRYDHVATRFNAAGIAVLAVDLRGHGGSIGTRGHIETRDVVRRDVDNLISTALKEYAGLPLVLYGHSLGGNVVLEYRLQGTLSYVPTAYLVTSPWVKLKRNVPAYAYYAVRVMEKVKPDLQLRANIKGDMLGNGQVIESLKSKMSHDCITARTALEGYTIAKQLYQGEIEDRHGGGSKPLILMHGSQDPICDVEGSRVIGKREGDLCTYVEWEGYLHELHNGNQDGDGSAIIHKMIELLLPYGEQA